MEGGRESEKGGRASLRSLVVRRPASSARGTIMNLPTKRERFFIELMTSDRKLQASREGSESRIHWNHQPPPITMWGGTATSELFACGTIMNLLSTLHPSRCGEGRQLVNTVHAAQ